MCDFMSDSTSLADIFILALIAAFIVLRLRSVLGRRTGEEKQPFNWGQAPNSPANAQIIELPQNRNGIGAVMAADPSFDPNGFLNGAKVAFSMIVNAFRIGDTTTLRPLVSDEVFSNFVKALEDKSLEQVQVVDVGQAEIVEAALVGSAAEITVKFASDQELRGQVSHVIDIWTFRRSLRSLDPTWVLVATRAAESS